MSTRTVFSILFFGAIAGWYGPDLVGAGGSRSAAAQDSATSAKDELAHGKKPMPRLAVNRRDAWLAGETVLERSSDGHFYADIMVDMRTYRVLIDTGASVVALTADDARDMGFDWDESRMQVIGRGASGDVHGVPVTIARMELGGFEASNVAAAIVPEGLDTTLLGQSFLSQIDKVDISGDRMTLGG